MVGIVVVPQNLAYLCAMVNNITTEEINLIYEYRYNSIDNRIRL